MKLRTASDSTASAVIAIVLVIVLVVAPLVGYVVNVVDVITKPQYQTLNVPNVVCGVGMLPIPPVTYVGAVCGFVRD